MAQLSVFCVSSGGVVTLFSCLLSDVSAGFSASSAESPGVDSLDFFLLWTESPSLFDSPDSPSWSSVWISSNERFLVDLPLPSTLLVSPIPAEGLCCDAMDISSGELARSPPWGRGASGMPAIDVSLSFSRTGRSPVSLSEVLPPSFEALSCVVSSFGSRSEIWLTLVVI